MQRHKLGLFWSLELVLVLELQLQLEPGLASTLCALVNAMARATSYSLQLCSASSLLRQAGQHSHLED